MTWYTVKTEQGIIRVTKFDELFNPIVSYHIFRLSKGEHLGCTCPAGWKPGCRHRIILDSFRQFNRINTGWFLNYDNMAWEPPISLMRTNLGR